MADVPELTAEEAVNFFAGIDTSTLLALRA